MNIKSGDVLAVFEPVKNIFHHNEDLSDDSDEKIQSNLEIPALELGDLSEYQRKMAREFLQKHNGMFASGQSPGDAQLIRQVPRTRGSRGTGTKNIRRRRYRGVKQSMVTACSVSYQKGWVYAILRRLQEAK